MRRQDKHILDHYRAQLERIRMSADINPFETKQAQAERIERAKTDFKYFVSTYLKHYILDENGAIIESPDFHISFAKKVKRNKRIKAIQRWARAHAKSVLSDLFIPLWLWINNDISYQVIIGNNEDKAIILLSDLQAEFEANELLKHDFGEQVKQGSWADGYFITKNGFIAKAIGMGQDVRGLRMKSKRPDYVSADDLEDKDTVRNPRKQDEIANWLLTSVIPTMDGNRARFIIANNRFAPRMINTVIEDMTEGWLIDQVNAYNPVTYEPTWSAKYTSEYWQEIEREIGVIAANAEYNNTPHIKGKIFTEAQIQWGKRPKFNQFQRIIAHWDIAYAGTDTSDFNAVRVWGLHNSDFWYIDSFVKQTKMREAVLWMTQFQKNLPPSIVIRWQFESQFWNDEVRRIIDEVEKESGINLYLVKVDTPKKIRKYDRIERLQPYYQNGRIFYDENKKPHSDTQVGLQQLYGIEPGYRTKDDAPDADEHAIAYLETFMRTQKFKARSGTFMKSKNRHWQ